MIIESIFGYLDFKLLWTIAKISSSPECVLAAKKIGRLPIFDLRVLRTFPSAGNGGAANFRKGDSSGGKAIKFRCFITKDNASQFPHLVKFINELQSKEVYENISKMINKDLSNSYVRVEVICDREGFWLKPHCDIKEKLMSGLIFVNNTNESEDLGTDFYNEKLEKVKTVPYKHNYGYLFTSGPNTWHGMEKKKIIKERRCIQVNYVTFETDWKVNN